VNESRECGRVEVEETQVLWELKREAVLLELEHARDGDTCHLGILHPLLPILNVLEGSDT
tara:strand:- start:349 stop:528 length:180 start_codon:yes stop_codon:yes gene_type:complete